MRITDKYGRKGTMSEPVDSKGTRRVQLDGKRSKFYTAQQVEQFIKR